MCCRWKNALRQGLLPSMKNGASTRAELQHARPALAFAVLGQARAEGKISPEQESAQLADLLTTWALSSSLETSRSCAKQVLSSARRTQALQSQQSIGLGERYAIH